MSLSAGTSNPLCADASAASAFASEPPARAAFGPLAALAPWSGCACERFELISRGDIVNGVRVRAEERSGPEGVAARRDGRALGKGAPLLLLAHDARGSTHAEAWSTLRPWIARGLDVAAIDLPLQGRRASAKLSERLVDAVAALARGEALDANGRLLALEFRQQAVCDLSRTRDALIATGDFDPGRVGLLAVGLGAWVADALLEAKREFAAASVLVQTNCAPAPRIALPGASNVLVVPSASNASERGGSGAWAAAAERVLASALRF